MDIFSCAIFALIIVGCVAWCVGNNKLNAILVLLRDSKKREVIMIAELDDLEVALTENLDVDDSIMLALETIAAQIEDLPAEKAALVDMAARLRAKSQAIKDAILNVTPPEPPIE